MKNRARAEQSLPLDELPPFNFESGEYVRSHNSGARALPLGQNQLELERRVERLQARVEDLEALLDERASELFLARETQRLLLGALPDAREAPAGALLVLDRSGTIETVNPAALRLLGYEESELVGQPLGKLLENPDATCLSEAQALAPEGTVLRTEQVLVGKSGLRQKVSFSIGALGVVDEYGDPRRLVCSAFDLGARKNWEVTVRHAEKLEAVGRLTAGVVHELGNPIQFVANGVHFLRESTADLLALLEKHRAVLRSIREGGSVAQAAEHATAAEDDADLGYLIQSMPKAFGACVDGLDRIATIARSVKEFAHPDPREMGEIDLNRAIQTTLTLASNEYKYVAHLRVDLGPLPPVVCHAGEVNQALLSLVVNAAHAIGEVVKGTEQKGRITVRTRLDGDHALVSVEDTGGGIPEPIRERIFEPFFTTKEVGKGTGQGLAIARSVVAGKHGGKLWFETVVGQGTTFFMRLPCKGQNTPFK
jgi:PAS domain S-box-containing protein